MTCSTAIDHETEIRRVLLPNGLVPLGWFDLEEQPALLIGNIGSSLWPTFSASDQLADGRPDPLNRWTEETVSALVDQLPQEMISEVRYPFGDVNWPFQSYAKQALGVEQSPIGLLIHPTYGLWTAFRAVLVFGGQFELPIAGKEPRPCDTCIEKPCLNTCPIGAFTCDAYDYVACKAHVASQAGKTCLKCGCLARQACPVGQKFAYDPPHQAFHMEAYI